MRQVKFTMAVVAVASLAAFNARAVDPPPYATPGFENPVTYTFTAASTGHVIAYFAGSTASFENKLGLSVNGGAPAVFGLDNKTTSVGTSIDFGLVTAGANLVFVMQNVDPGLGNVYSDPTLNAPYDGDGKSHNHIYSTVYGGTDPGTYPGVPAGTYVAFEDLPISRTIGVNNYGPPDWNYHDENFVFTNIATRESVTPLPSTALCGGALLAGLVIIRRSLRRSLRRQTV